MRAAFAALSGLIAGLCALAVAELVAAAVRPEAGPITAVGGAVIDRTPPALKDFAIRNFGTHDKLVLELGILVLLAGFAVVVGVLALRHRVIGSAAVLVFGVVGAVAAVGRPEGRFPDALPSVVGAVLAAGVLYLLVGRLAPASGPSPAAGGRGGEAVSGTFDRRGFVIAATAAAAASAGAGLLGRRLTSAVQAGATASRHDLVLPVPASAAPAVPAGADLRIRGLSSFVTPNKSFYRVDTALVVPRIDANDWKLRIHGKGVQRPLTLSFQDLLHREIIERDITLTCVSNEVGGPYVGNARWIGVRLADLLREAGVKPPSRGGPADQIITRSVDGMTIGTPVETVMDGRDALLALGMNGEPLPFEHGFPVRMVVPGLYGYVSACKWIKELELTTFADYDAYWVKRSWSQQAPIKTESRIDTPRPFASPKAGTIPVAGVAWAQHRGVSRVEVRVDGGPWHTAKLAAEDSPDTWRQWVWEWPATSGNHTLEVRATDRTGATQTDRRVGTVPNGATGWHSVVVGVS
ncbi:molybdopterin-dependent oxidoreductase [Streptomyces brevispora]|uniref:DMSO/TMAO reductase YedYZ molybdopterin-dependent catalytic subunit n=1 Tax=Streptomyces brevispora TaxID=887462 RepID=A0A561URM6_9ACTN|nr:molybdopterin-dependent oxidoreductase [Streptomyces brevispora]TWG02022.1 DMSO/TMAO reductase YedYZ molybdopterin-dependent catalytic subunit [Streptomyces brevispora]